MGKQFTKIGFKEAGDKGVEISFKVFDEDGFKGTDDKARKALPHPDFNAALQRLTYHLAFITDFADQDKFTTFPNANFEGLRICVVSLSGEDEKEGIVITGYRTTKRGKGFAFNTPLHRFSEEWYKFQADLQTQIQAVIKAAEDYLGGKVGVKQTELAFDKGSKKEEEEEEPASAN